jgi:hypothetical protein
MYGEVNIPIKDFILNMVVKKSSIWNCLLTRWFFTSLHLPYVDMFYDRMDEVALCTPDLTLLDYCELQKLN